MDSVKPDNDGELTSTMGNVLSTSSKDEKNDTNDATPTSSTDANTTTTTSQIISDDPISSTSIDVIEQSKSKSTEIVLQNSKEVAQTESDGTKKTSNDAEADLLEMSISNISSEKITEDVEDLVHDLESLLGESTDSFNIPMKRKEDSSSSEEKDESNSQLRASSEESDENTCTESVPKINVKIDAIYAEITVETSEDISRKDKIDLATEEIENKPDEESDTKICGLSTETQSQIECQTLADENSVENISEFVSKENESVVQETVNEDVNRTEKINEQDENKEVEDVKVTQLKNVENITEKGKTEASTSVNKVDDAPLDMVDDSQQEISNRNEDQSTNIAGVESSADPSETDLSNAPVEDNTGESTHQTDILSKENICRETKTEDLNDKVGIDSDTPTAEKFQINEDEQIQSECQFKLKEESDNSPIEEKQANQSPTREKLNHIAVLGCCDSTEEKIATSNDKLQDCEQVDGAIKDVEDNKAKASASSITEDSEMPEPERVSAEESECDDNENTEHQINIPDKHMSGNALEVCAEQSIALIVRIPETTNAETDIPIETIKHDEATECKPEQNTYEETGGIRNYTSSEATTEVEVKENIEEGCEDCTETVPKIMEEINPNPNDVKSSDIKTDSVQVSQEVDPNETEETIEDCSHETKFIIPAEKEKESTSNTTEYCEETDIPKSPGLEVSSNIDLKEDSPNAIPRSPVKELECPDTVEAEKATESTLESDTVDDDSDEVLNPPEPQEVKEPTYVEESVENVETDSCEKFIENSQDVANLEVDLKPKDDLKESTIVLEQTADSPILKDSETTEGYDASTSALERNSLHTPELENLDVGKVESDLKPKDDIEESNLIVEEASDSPVLKDLRGNSDPELNSSVDNVETSENEVISKSSIAGTPNFPSESLENVIELEEIPSTVVITDDTLVTDSKEKICNENTCELKSTLKSVDDGAVPSEVTDETLGSTTEATKSECTSSAEQLNSVTSPGMDNISTTETNRNETTGKEKSDEISFTAEADSLNGKSEVDVTTSVVSEPEVDSTIQLSASDLQQKEVIDTDVLDTQSNDISSANLENSQTICESNETQISDATLTKMDVNEIGKLHEEISDVANIETLDNNDKTDNSDEPSNLEMGESPTSKKTDIEVEIHKCDSTNVKTDESCDKVNINIKEVLEISVIDVKVDDDTKESSVKVNSVEAVTETIHIKQQNDATYQETTETIIETATHTVSNELGDVDIEEDIKIDKCKFVTSKETLEDNIENESSNLENIENLRNAALEDPVEEKREKFPNAIASPNKNIECSIDGSNENSSPEDKIKAIVIDTSPQEKIVLDPIHCPQLNLSEDSDSEDVVPRLVLESEETIHSKKNAEVIYENIEDNKKIQTVPEIEDVLADENPTNEADSIMDTQENLETILAVANLQSVETTNIPVDPQLSESERRDMEAIRKAVESITEAPADQYGTSVDAVGDLMKDVDVPTESVVMNADVMLKSEEFPQGTEIKLIDEGVSSDVLENIPEETPLHVIQEQVLDSEVLDNIPLEVAPTAIPDEIMTSEEELNTVSETDTNLIREVEVLENVHVCPEEVLEKIDSEGELTNAASEHGTNLIKEQIIDSDEVLNSVSKTGTSLVQEELIDLKEVYEKDPEMGQSLIIEVKDSELLDSISVPNQVGPEDDNPSETCTVESVDCAENVPDSDNNTEIENVSTVDVKGESSADTSEDKIIMVPENDSCEVKDLPDSSDIMQEEPEQSDCPKEKDTKQKVTERRRHKKSTDKLEELSINTDVPEKEKPYSPKITIKPIKVPDEEVSTTSNSDTEIGKGSLKMTITKQSDKMHSILKICEPENSDVVQEPDEPIPKLIIKPKMQQVEQQHSPKMATRSSKQGFSPTSTTPRSGSPRITIKPVVKPEKTESVSPLKIKIGIKPEETSRKHSPKLNIKPVTKPEEEVPKENIQSPIKLTIKPVVKPPEELEQVHSPRITIKPIPKPEEKEADAASPKLNIKPVKKPEENETEDDEKERPNPKVTIKPIVKPQEPDTQNSEVDDEVKERIVLKINKGSLPTPTKDIKKREHPSDDDKSEKLAKITVKFSKEGGHPHIVQQSEESNKRSLEDQLTPEKSKKQKLEIESPVSTRSKHKEVPESSVETRAKHKDVTESPTNETKYKDTKLKPKEIDANEAKLNIKSKPKELESGDANDAKQKDIKPKPKETDASEPKQRETKSKHKQELTESPIEPKKAKLRDGVSPIPVYESTRSRHRQDSTSDASKPKQKEHNNPGPAEPADGSTDDVKIVEPKTDSPIVISEDSRSQDSGACITMEDTKDPLAEIPVFKITADSVQTLTPKQEMAISMPPAPITPIMPTNTPPMPTPRKRGRPRKVPIVVREEFKDREEGPKSENPSNDDVPQLESGRPKRSCRGQNVRATLGIKPRKPRGPGRGRGSKRGMGTRGVSMKHEELSN